MRKIVQIAVGNYYARLAGQPWEIVLVDEGEQGQARI
jgi:hypothetical protein